MPIARTIARWTAVTAVILILTGVALIGSELALRFVFRDITTTADNGSYFAGRWYRQPANARQNKWGFRERNFSVPKPAGTYRIVVIGDSLTFGQGVSEPARFTHLIETELNQSGNRFEVLNFGVAGAETTHEIRYLAKILAHAQPDYVLLQWFMNDIEGDDKSQRPQPRVLVQNSILHPRLFRGSVLYFLLNRQWMQMQETLGFIESYTSYMHRRFADPKSDASRSGMRTLAEFVAACRNARVPLGLVLFPQAVPDMRANYPFGFLHDRTLDLCSREGLRCLDLREAYAAEPDYRRLWVNRFDPHPSAAANRLAAEHILHTFGADWRERVAAPR